MTDRRLQKSYCVTGLQPRRAYNDAMNLAFNKRAGVCRGGLALVALLGTGVLATACGAASSTIRQSEVRSGSATSLEKPALAYVNCMRSHGEPNMPEPTFTGRHATLHITPNSGVDPGTRQFTAATTACQHLVPHGNGPSRGQTITPVQQADYLKAVACMRSHGFPAFPNPVFQNNRVTFSTAGPRIDTNSSQYKRALTTCQKLIPAGLPDSGPRSSSRPITARWRCPDRRRASDGSGRQARPGRRAARDVRRRE
jgi:hypothetical protein